MVRSLLVSSLAVALVAIASAQSVCTSRPTLKLFSGYASKGLAAQQPAVKELQKLLNTQLGASLTVDGLFGEGTDAAVRRYQRSKGLQVDGIVGPNTWGALCSANPGTPPVSGCGSLNNPHAPAPKGTSKWNPITQFVVDKVKACFPGQISCSTYTGDAASDHPGNAADCFPGPAGKCDQFTKEQKANGDALAKWAVDNHQALKINYVIWQNLIWSRRNPSWRSQGKAGCTFAHFDHVHISVITP